MNKQRADGKPTKTRLTECLRVRQDLVDYSEIAEVIEHMPFVAKVIADRQHSTGISVYIICAETCNHQHILSILGHLQGIKNRLH